MAGSTVTIDKVYFETLLRRAQFNVSGTDFTIPVLPPTVTIPKIDHDRLLGIAREYANMRQNLHDSGIPEDTMAFLIGDPPSRTKGPSDDTNHVAPMDNTPDAFQSQHPFSEAQMTSTLRSNGLDYTYGRHDNYNPRNGGHGSNGLQSQNPVIDDYSTLPDISADAFFEGGDGYGDQMQGRRVQYPKHAKRTVLLSKLPEGVTHAEIVEAVRGGTLLDIYVRVTERTAAISFLEEDHAKDFFHHVKRNDLYVRNKRVEIRWNDRQFTLPSHVASQIGAGATRNFIIRNIDPKHTEEAIRNDLEHIHNLAIISITFKGQNAHIATNSVHNAMYARTCIMSRTTYKGSRIDWDTDECAAPIQKPQPLPRKENGNVKKKAPPPTNRFELLNIGDSEDSSDQDNPDTTGTSCRTANSDSTAGGATL